MNKTLKKALITAASVLFWLLVWYIAAAAMDLKILFASPVDVAAKLRELLFREDFFPTVGYTLGRILLGFAIGLVGGTALAAAAGKVGFIRQLLSPLITVLKSIPVASFAILAIIYVGSKNLGILVSVVIAIPIVYSNVLEGIDSLDPKLKTMADIFEIPAGKRFWGIYMSQLLPYFRSASRLAMGLCWKSGVAAEVIGLTEHSIGGKLQDSKIYLETEELFAWTIVIILLSYICEKLFMLLVNAVVRRVERM